MINKCVKLFVVITTLLMTGSCTQLDWQGKRGEYHEKYTITYESIGQKPIAKEHSSIENRLECFKPVPTLELPPPTPTLTKECAIDKDCSDLVLTNYIQDLRSTMTRNRNRVTEYKKDQEACLMKINSLP